MTRAAPRRSSPPSAVGGPGGRPAASAELVIWEVGWRAAASAAAVALRLGFRPVFARRGADLGPAPGGVMRVALVGLPAAEDALAEAEDHRGRRPVTIASAAGDPVAAASRAHEVGADLVASRPHSLDKLGPVLVAARQLASVRGVASELEGEGAVLRERIESWESDPATGFYPFAFFKRVLFMEIKRAKRYGYSLAACLVGIDGAGGARPDGEGEEGDAGAGPEGEEGDAGAESDRRTRVAAAIASCIRDIDLPVDVAEDRFLVFLPYTDSEGAERVGARIAATVDYTGAGDGASVSVGIAALRPGMPVSFARLMRDAGAALRAAQLKGGGRVVTRR